MKRLAALFLILALPASAEPPNGFLAFCREHPGDCLPIEGHRIEAVERLSQLWRIQRAVNRSYTYRSDDRNWGVENKWSYPFVYADCEDFVIEKRKRLLKMGWSTHDLRIAVAIRKGIPHAVLLADVGSSTFVLDNTLSEVVPVEDLPYEWVTVQSRDNPKVWVRF